MTATASWACYLLRCADDSLCCGIVNDLAKRLAVPSVAAARARRE